MSSHAQSLSGPGFDAAREKLRPEPIVTGGLGMEDVTNKVCSIVEGRTPIWWWVLFLISGAIASLGMVMIGYQIATGVGTWGLNQPVGWGWDITNFVFWIGIGHAGTLISAILFLLRQKWRTSINRAAEAMTLFAVACAGIYPLIHVGRAWRIYFTAPVPNHLEMWPNFRSPLMWDVFAVSTYATVSLLFWYMGLIPDLATMRDRAKGPIRRFIYGILAMGWRNGNRQWRHYEMAYLLLAGLSTPLVLSVHTIVSFDFATSQLFGWHTTIFPPYFVAGAIFSGFAMVLTLLIPLRSACNLKHIITETHLDNMCKVILATSLIVGYAYATEFFIAFYSANPYEQFVFFENRMRGPFAWAFWSMVFCNVVAPQLFWLRTFRRTPVLIFVICIIVNIGMWFERFVIIVTSLHRDALPSSWGHFTPTWVEILTFIGTFGIFMSLFLLFMRFLPMVAISEVKGAMGDKAWTPSKRPTPPAPARPEKPWGIIAEFAGPDALKKAARGVRAAGYKRFDVYTPYPVHGMDKAMGLGRSPLGILVFGAGMTGAAVGLGLQGFTSVIDYPLITSGKPYFSFPAFVPITFELGVLFAAFAALLGMFALNNLPNWYHPSFNHPAFDLASDNRFFLVIEARDSYFHAERCEALLTSLGGHDVALLHP